MSSTPPALPSTPKATRTGSGKALAASKAAAANLTETSTSTTSPKPDARQKLLDVALNVIRTKGYADTSVEDLCKAAGVTKGAFFHHFATKDALGVAAAAYWSHITGQLFANAPYHAPTDPLDRILAYIDFRIELIAGEVPEFTCLVGTLVQEVYHTHPEIRDAAAASIFNHAGTLTADFAAASALYQPATNATAWSLALHTQAVLQGAFILAKASNSRDVAIESARHLRRYVELLFQPEGRAHAKES